jgi:hypothetical protein
VNGVCSALWEKAAIRPSANREAIAETEQNGIAARQEKLITTPPQTSYDRDGDGGKSVLT